MRRFAPRSDDAVLGVDELLHETTVRKRRRNVDDIAPMRADPRLLVDTDVGSGPTGREQVHRVDDRPRVERSPVLEADATT
jgi:hypothetical protein